jgi:hypothetical protein
MSKTTSKPVPDSPRALITVSIVRAVPGNTSRALLVIALVGGQQLDYLLADPVWVGA